MTGRGAHEVDDTGAAGVIALRVDRISQLFDILDPFPFRIAILMSGHADQLGAALSTYFGYRVEVIARNLRELFRIGRISLPIGLIALATCVLTAPSLTVVLGTGSVSRFVDEGLVILGWVANWKPIEIFLYDWWPLARRPDLYRRLSGASVDLRAAAP